MGMRRNIALEFEENKKIYLYTHWNAEGLEDTLANSLQRAESRWDDSAYLARVIFSDMTANAGDELTGFGMSTVETSGDFPTLEVDLQAKTVNGDTYEDFINHPEAHNAYVD